MIKSCFGPGLTTTTNKRIVLLVFPMCLAVECLAQMVITKRAGGICHNNVELVIIKSHYQSLFGDGIQLVETLFDMSLMGLEVMVEDMIGH